MTDVFVSIPGWFIETAQANPFGLVSVVCLTAVTIIFAVQIWGRS